MDFETVYYQQNYEYLRILYPVLFGIPNNKIINKIFYVIFVMKILDTVAETYFFFTTFSWANFLKYGPVYFAGLNMVLNCYISLVLRKAYTPLIEGFKNDFYWHVKMASPALKGRLYSLIRHFQSNFVLELLMTEALLLYTAYLFYGRPQEYSVSYRWIYGVSPDFSYYAKHLTVLTMCFMAVPIISAMWYTMYILIYVGAQIYMLADYLRYLEVDLANETILSEESQAYVRRFLRFFVKRHHSFLDHIKLISDINLVYNFYYLGGTFCIWLYSILMIFSESYDWYLTIISNVAFWLTIIWSMSDSEHFEDTSRSLAAAFYNVPFYLWNVADMKTFLIAHQYLSSREIRTPMVSFIRVNMDIVKWFAKAMYTAFNLYRSVSNR